MNETFDKWEKTGLLDGFESDFLKSECATKLEEAGQMLIGDMNSYMKEVDSKIGEEGFFAGCILPLIVRIFMSDDLTDKLPYLDLDWLFKDFGDYSIDRFQEFKDLEKYHQVDGLAEMLTMYMLSLEYKL